MRLLGNLMRHKSPFKSLRLSVYINEYSMATDRRLWIALTHAIFGAFLCISIIGIPFGLQHFKLTSIALSPFGRDIVYV